jgi:hypothetical protein
MEHSTFHHNTQFEPRCIEFWNKRRWETVTAAAGVAHDIHYSTKYEEIAELIHEACCNLDRSTWEDRLTEAEREYDSNENNGILFTVKLSRYEDTIRCAIYGHTGGPEYAWAGTNRAYSEEVIDTVAAHLAEGKSNEELANILIGRLG